jgi:hypothetical protein
VSHFSSHILKRLSPFFNHFLKRLSHFFALWSCVAWRGLVRVFGF